MLKDFLLGRELDAKWSDIPMNMMKTFGWSKYTIDTATGNDTRDGKARPLTAIAGVFVPPYRMFDDLARTDPKAVEYLPIAGRLLYSWGLGGREDHNLKQNIDNAIEKRDTADVLRVKKEIKDARGKGDKELAKEKRQELKSVMDAQDAERVREFQRQKRELKEKRNREGGRLGFP